MIQALIEVELTDREFERFMGILNPVLEPIQYEPGCLRCTLWNDTKSARRMCFVTEWRTRDEFDRYLRSDWFRQILVAMDVSSREPVFRLQGVREASGFKYAAQLMGLTYGDNGFETDRDQINF